MQCDAVSTLGEADVLAIFERYRASSAVAEGVKVLRAHHGAGALVEDAEPFTSSGVVGMGGKRQISRRRLARSGNIQ